MDLLRKLYNPHCLIITVLIFLFIWFFQFLFFNMHFLDPFNNGLRDYEVSDIVYSQFRDPDEVEPVQNIILLNSGQADRATLATILQRIRPLQPKSIGLDVNLVGRKDSLTDASLKAAIDSLPQLVLAGQLTDFIDSLHQFKPMIGCDPYFAAGSMVGYTNFVSEDTSTIRLFSPYEETTDSIVRAFAVEIAKKYNPEKVKELFRHRHKVERIYYTGNQSSFIRLDAQYLLDSTLYQEVIAQDVLRDKIVLIGYYGNHAPGEPELDRFFTPLNKRYTGKTYPDMYGLVIHANIVTMILREQYIFEFSRWFLNFFAFIFCYANVLIFYWIHNEVYSTFHGITRLLQILELILIFFVIALFFYHFRIKIDFSNGILGMIVAYDFVMIYETLIRQKIKFLENL